MRYLKGQKLLCYFFLRGRKLRGDTSNVVQLITTHFIPVIKSKYISAKTDFN